eukprot:m.33604 g.33604  ORF g.33604 m.33604 type:complete len:278 (-) comp9644_c0_seq2:88-921(-)
MGGGDAAVPRVVREYPWWVASLQEVVVLAVLLLQLAIVHVVTVEASTMLSHPSAVYSFFVFWLQVFLSAAAAYNLGRVIIASPVKSRQLQGLLTGRDIDSPSAFHMSPLFDNPKLSPTVRAILTGRPLRPFDLRFLFRFFLYGVFSGIFAACIIVFALMEQNEHRAFQYGDALMIFHPIGVFMKAEHTMFNVYTTWVFRLSILQAIYCFGALIMHWILTVTGNHSRILNPDPDVRVMAPYYFKEVFGKYGMFLWWLPFGGLDVALSVEELSKANKHM